MEKFIEAWEDKLYRHSYAFVDNNHISELKEWISNHEYFNKYKLIIGESNSYQTRIELAEKRNYSY